MRLSASTIIASVAAALIWMGGSAVSTQAAQSGVYQVSDDLGTDVAAQQQASCGFQEGCQESCAVEEQPSVMSNVFGRILNRCECGPCWSFTADAVALQRSSTRSQVLFRDANDAEEVLNSQHVDFPVAIGFQVSAIRHGRCGWDIELGYFQIDGWAANATAPDGSFLLIDNSGSGDFVSGGAVRYTSALHLAELNVRRQLCEGFTVLAGFRAGELNELYSASGTNANLEPLSLNTKTFNHLYGLQLGADWEFYNMGGPLRVSALCKAGVYGNSASQSSLASIGSVEQVLGDKRNQATFMGEAGAVAIYDVTCHLSFRASCQAMWIEGVALAPEQIPANDFNLAAPGIDTHGGIFAYGGGLGMELKF